MQEFVPFSGYGQRLGSSSDDGCLSQGELGDCLLKWQVVTIAWVFSLMGVDEEALESFIMDVTLLRSQVLDARTWQGKAPAKIMEDFSALNGEYAVMCAVRKRYRDAREAAKTETWWTQTVCGNKNI